MSDSATTVNNPESRCSPLRAVTTRLTSIPGEARLGNSGRPAFGEDGSMRWVEVAPPARSPVALNPR